MQTDEASLIERSQRGDLDAFKALVLAYQGQVSSVCLRMLGSPQPAEDATQEAFVAAFRAVSRFRRGSLRAWLLRIAANVCYDELRRRDVQGLAYEEVAEATGASLGTVKSRISRGRAALRDFLLAQGELLPSRFRPSSERS